MRLLLVAVLVAVWTQQVDQGPAPSESPVRGLYNWIHSTGDAERSFAFYRDVFGIELARSPFAGTAAANAPPEPIRPVSQAGSDALVWDLTNTHGSRFRTVFMRAANTPFGLELSEFFDVPRSERQANAWDPGASKLIFTVRDLDAVMGRLKTRRTPVVTIGGVALNTPSGRAMLVRDPDGYLVEVRQASSAAVTAAKASGDVIETAIWISVARRERALAFYQTLLGFQIRATRIATGAELRVNGLTEGRLTQTVLSIPGIEATVVLAEFARPDDLEPGGHAVRVASAGCRRAAIPARGRWPRRAARAHGAGGLPFPQRRRQAHSTTVRTIRVCDRPRRHPRRVRRAGRPRALRLPVRSAVSSVPKQGVVN